MPPSAAMIARLLDAHGPALALYAAQWTTEPEDCVQEALVELARRPAAPESPAAWLYRVVKRRALNASRAARRRRGREEEAFRRRLAARGGADDPTRLATIADALASLDPPAREALVLRTWGGLTFAELGEVLGVATATAARRYENGLRRLREVWTQPETPPLANRRTR